MKRSLTRRRLLVAGGLLLLALAAWFEPTGVVRGWLRGEAFYDGRPTNYWSRELGRWEYADLWGNLGALRILTFSNTTPAGVVVADVDEVEDAPPVEDPVPLNAEVLHTVYFTSLQSGGYTRIPGLLDKLAGLFGQTFDHGDRPALLSGDPEAEAVLRELLDDDDPIVRAHAQRGLDQIQRGPPE
jgi:hypothetical protein